MKVWGFGKFKLITDLKPACDCNIKRDGFLEPHLEIQEDGSFKLFCKTCGAEWIRDGESNKI